MKTFLSIIFFFAFTAFANAQFGVAVKYEKNNYKAWQQLYDFNQDRLYAADLTFGVNYWLRLKKYRVEFLPEVSYTIWNGESTISGIIPTEQYSSGLTRIGFQIHTQIYPMDLEGDCNCPTWGKDNSFIKKGFYFSLSPGVDYLIHDLVYEGESQENQNSLAFKIGVGGGLDIGVSKLITISPFVMVNFYPTISSSQFNNLQSICDSCSETVANDRNTQVSAGIRLIFRPDYKF